MYVKYFIGYFIRGILLNLSIFLLGNMIPMLLGKENDI